MNHHAYTENQCRLRIMNWILKFSSHRKKRFGVFKFILTEFFFAVLLLYVTCEWIRTKLGKCNKYPGCREFFGSSFFWAWLSLRNWNNFLDRAISILHLFMWDRQEGTKESPTLLFTYREGFILILCNTEGLTPYRTLVQKYLFPCGPRKGLRTKIVQVCP